MGRDPSSPPPPQLDDLGGRGRLRVDDGLDALLPQLQRLALLVLAKRQITLFRCTLGHELSDRCLRGGEIPEIPHLAATTTIGDRYCITRF